MCCCVLFLSFLQVEVRLPPLAPLEAPLSDAHAAPAAAAAAKKVAATQACFLSFPVLALRPPRVRSFASATEAQVEAAVGARVRAHALTPRKAAEATGNSLPPESNGFVPLSSSSAPSVSSPQPLRSPEFASLLSTLGNGGQMFLEIRSPLVRSPPGTAPGTSRRVRARLPLTFRPIR